MCTTHLQLRVAATLQTAFHLDRVLQADPLKLPSRHMQLLMQQLLHGIPQFRFALASMLGFTNNERQLKRKGFAKLVALLEPDDKAVSNW